MRIQYLLTCTLLNLISATATSEDRLAPRSVYTLNFRSLAGEVFERVPLRLNTYELNRIIEEKRADFLQSKLEDALNFECSVLNEYTAAPGVDINDNDIYVTMLKPEVGFMCNGSYNSNYATFICRYPGLVKDITLRCDYQTQHQFLKNEVYSLQEIQDGLERYSIHSPAFGIQSCELNKEAFARLMHRLRAIEAFACDPRNSAGSSTCGYTFFPLFDQLLWKEYRSGEYPFFSLQRYTNESYCRVSLQLFNSLYLNTLVYGLPDSFAIPHSLEEFMTTLSQDANITLVFQKMELFGYVFKFNPTHVPGRVALTEYIPALIKLDPDKVTGETIKEQFAQIIQNFKDNVNEINERLEAMAEQAT